ncbi:MAG: hydantoinase/oxoprolinase family protein [Planctomycetota bacterium]
MSWLALDIGGANLKAADGLGYAASRPFPLWKQPDQLADALRGMIAAGPPADRLAVTMTGELADCYPSRREGVAAIAAAVHQAADGKPCSFYAIDGRLAPLDAARAPLDGVSRGPLDYAATNWHALAAFAADRIEGRPGLLVDIGSTTIDVIPLNKGVATRSRSDLDRLRAAELLYTGIERTPLCAVLQTATFSGQPVPVAAEFFATTADAYLLLGHTAEDPDNSDTADGRPRTRADAARRIGRMLCTELTEPQAALVAAEVRHAQTRMLRGAITTVAARLPQPPAVIVASGHGGFLLADALAGQSFQANVLDLAAELGPEVSRCAPAHALAVIAAHAEVKP